MPVLDADTFVRSNQSGWGTASGGHTWAATGHASTQSIASDEGIISANGGNDTANQLGSVTSADQELLIRLTIHNSADIAGVLGRYTSLNSTYKFLYYTGAVHINKTVSSVSTADIGTAYTITLTTGTYYWFRFRIKGTSLYGRVWQDGTTEPTTWHVTATDSGLSTGGYALLANTGTGAGISFDHFTITTIPNSLNAYSRPKYYTSSVLRVRAQDTYQTHSALLSRARDRFIIKVPSTYALVGIGQVTFIIEKIAFVTDSFGGIDGYDIFTQAIG